MNTDKALLQLSGKPFYQILYETLQLFCDEIIISTNNPEIQVSDAKIVADEFKNIGPAGGIYSALAASKSQKNIIVSVDTPFVSKALFNFLLKNDSKKTDVTIVSEGDKLHPLTGIYSKHFSEILYDEIKKKHYKIREIIRKSSFNILDVSNEAFYNENLLMNINTPEDYHGL
jgi:molybdenum cofactor guanylyltransferase